ncbi:MAG: FecR domain-containing protein [Sediminicola sp.]
MSAEEVRLKYILEKIKASGKLDPEDMIGMTSAERDLVHELFKEGLVKESAAFMEDMDLDREWGNLTKELERPVVPLWKPILKYAAIFIGVFAITYFFQMKEMPMPKVEVVEDFIKLRTGQNRVQLIDQQQTMEIVSASGVVIGKQEGNKISYSPDSKIDEITYNELDVPNGKMFNVELSDGTLVHLNSGTKLRYPVKFLKGQKREVFVDGEAYFDVAKDKDHPFIVNADDVAVTVLGTKFNVSSYKDDSEITTVLVEGSVNMTNSVVPGDNLLVPGMKGSWHKTAHSTKLEKVDTAHYIGWIKGELIFRNATFGNMERTLERKYNVDIDNSNKELEGKILTASFNSKIESIQDVLNALREIQPFDYTITDQHIQIQTQK